MTLEPPHQSWKYIDTIPIDEIRILNPRVRDKRKFQLLVENVSKVGLKRPITVSRRSGSGADKAYDLVCGQGRVEAFMALGQTHIPAMIIEASRNDCFVMSLVENCARRQHSAVELLQSIATLREQGYSDKIIGEKIGHTSEYVNMIGGLLERGEERLLSAVEAGTLPLSIAVEIAKTDEEGAQAALADAYMHKKLRGKKLIAAQKLLTQRSLKGKRKFEQAVNRTNAPRLSLTSEAVVNAYKKATSEQKLLRKKAELTQGRLLFAVEAMRSLLSEKEFMSLLILEGLDTLPAPLKKRFG